MDANEVKSVAKSLWALNLADVFADYGGRLPAGCKLEEWSPDPSAEAIDAVRDMIGKVESHFGPIDRMADAIGIDNVTTAYYILMRAIGHGVGLDDDHSEECEHAETSLGFNPAGHLIYLEDWRVRDAAETWMDANSWFDSRNRYRFPKELGAGFRQGIYAS